jgi:hypothetical protein
VRTLTAVLLVLVLALGTEAVGVPARAPEPDVGVQVRFEAEAVTVSTKRLRSDEWKQIASWLPWIGMLFSLSGREIVTQHEKALTGSFLGLPLRGRLIVLQSTKVGGMSPIPTVQWAPSELVLELPNGALYLRATSAAGVYRFESDPKRSGGVFSGIVARVEARIFGISDPNSIVRARVVLGFGSVEEAARALTVGLGPEDSAAVTGVLEQARAVLMPFPAFEKPPQETLVRWMVVGRSADAVSVQVLILVGQAAPGQEKKTRRVRVIAIPTGGRASTVYEKEHEPGDQVELLVSGAPPVVVLIYVDSEVSRQFKAE